MTQGSLFVLALACIAHLCSAQFLSAPTEVILAQGYDAQIVQFGSFYDGFPTMTPEVCTAGQMYCSLLNTDATHMYRVSSSGTVRIVGLASGAYLTLAVVVSGEILSNITFSQDGDYSLANYNDGVLVPSRTYTPPALLYWMAEVMWTGTQEVHLSFPLGYRGTALHLFWSQIPNA